MRGHLLDQEVEGIMRPIRSDLAPVSALSRDVGLRAGAGVEARLEELESLPSGAAVMTPGGGIPQPFLIHASVSEVNEPQTSLNVQRAVRNGLRRAAEWGLSSVALPPFGLGVGDMGAEDAAAVLSEILVDHVSEGEPPLDLVVVVSTEYEETVFSQAVKSLIRERFPGHG
ncbi:MAG: macro domain-containing protein [Gemmatimonadota bacterium]|nr:macro domain-containing protein [Gemmatimonadota bacterium]